MQYRIRTSQDEAYEKLQINSTVPKPTRQLADEKSRHTYFSEKAVDHLMIQMRAQRPQGFLKQKAKAHPLKRHENQLAVRLKHELLQLSFPGRASMKF